MMDFVAYKCRRESDVTFMVTELLEEVANSLMGRLHDAHKNLQFWKARAEVGCSPSMMILLHLKCFYVLSSNCK